MNADLNNKKQVASALLLVMWALVVMSICVLGLVEYVYSDMDVAISRKKDARALELAESGFAIAMNPLVSRRDDVLAQTLAPGEKFEAHLRSEGGRLNINTVLQRKQWDILENLFREWGLDEVDNANLVDAFQSWAYPPPPGGQQPAAPSPTPASLPPGVNVSGMTGTAQQSAVPQLLRNFESVDQMMIIPGMDRLVEKKPDWRNYFTIWSSGALDMNDAPPDLIAAVCAIVTGRAEQFVRARLGPDGKPDTEDDLVFTTGDQVRQLLGMSPGDFAKIQDRLSVDDPTVRIESTGILGTYRRKIIAVVRRGQTPPIYFQWQEQ